MNLQPIRDLIQNQRWAALASLGGEEPIASQVAYAVQPDFSGYLLHLSQLASHTRALLDKGSANLSISEPDDGRNNPQTLARVTLFGRARPLTSSDTDYTAAKNLYLKRLPTSEPLFGFSDFLLFEVSIEKVRHVGGFGAARTLEGQRLRPTRGA